MLRCFCGLFEMANHPDTPWYGPCSGDHRRRVERSPSSGIAAEQPRDRLSLGARSRTQVAGDVDERAEQLGMSIAVRSTAQVPPIENPTMPPVVAIVADPGLLPS